MLKISSNVWSHQSIHTGDKYSVLDVLASEPSEITTFPELVKAVARLSFHNPEQVLFFRGQSREYLKKIGDGRRQSSFYPEIYREPGGALSDNELARRFNALRALSEKLIHRLKSEGIQGHEKLSKFPELAWAVLQHYKVCATPLLDVTHSLRVAASFALSEGAKDGFLYAFGFPHPNGTITYSAEHELLNVRLLSVCPPEAHRPYFQEGFLVGTFPTVRLRKRRSLDVGVRLIAKFRLVARGFWSASYHAIPRSALFPEGDPMDVVCKSL